MMERWSRPRLADPGPKTPVRYFLILLVLFAANGAVSAADYPRKFGKSNAQILAMGSNKWMEFQGARAGQSTADMSEGMAAYRSALRWRNDRLSARSSATLRTRIGALRPLLVDYTGHLMSLGSFMTGGGSIWTNIHAGTLMELEETLYALLSGKVKSAKPHTTGMVKRQFERLAGEIEQHSRDTYNSPEKTANARKDLATARASFFKITALAAKFDRKGSDHILAYCQYTARTAEGMEQ